MSKKMFSGFVIASAIIYASCLYAVLFVSFGRGDIMRAEHMRFIDAMNLTPFKTIVEYSVALIDGSNSETAIMNLAGNLLLLLPLGFYLPFFVRKTAEIGVFAVVVAAIIIVVEVAQIVTRTGSLDIDDFILNLSGALAGIAIWKHMPLFCAMFRRKCPAEVHHMSTTLVKEQAA